MITPVYVGIDIAKHHLDIAVPGRAPWRIANERTAIAAFVASLDAPIVVFEATGVYDEVLRRALEASGIAYARVNPERARDFARALGRRAKTDRIDASMLAEMGRRLAPPATRPRDPRRLALARWHKRRDQLVAMRQQERVRLSEESDGALCASLIRHIDLLDAEIAEADKASAALLEADAAIAEADRLLRSVPGVGPVTAITLIALMPELGHSRPKPLAALAGLAPFNADSGTRQAARTIRGGRRRVRQALYMAALTASRSNPRFKAFAQALIAKGKPKKLVLVAIARKLLTILNAVLQDKTPFANA
jgi:transposase